jgi:hypothetical protein
MTGLHRRRKRTTTAEQYAQMLRRMIAAYGPRIGEEPMVALSHLTELEDALADAANLGIHLAIQSGESPTTLATAWGTSRQTIYKRAELGAEVAKQRRVQKRLSGTSTARPRELSSLLDGVFLPLQRGEADST